MGTLCYNSILIGIHSVHILWSQLLDCWHPCLSLNLCETPFNTSDNLVLSQSTASSSSAAASSSSSAAIAASSSSAAAIPAIAASSSSATAASSSSATAAAILHWLF